MNPPQPVVYGSGLSSLRLATGSPGELGLLKALAECFSQKADASLHWIKAGAGQSLQLLHDRQVDVAMVHAPALVDKAVQEGWGTEKTLLGSNEFFLVGPKADPALASGSGEVVEAFQRIASKECRFISRGDNSGTHQKEMDIWRLAGVVPRRVWLIPARDFMTACLLRADAEKAYFLCDSSTWLMERRNVPELKLLLRGDLLLINIYHALVSPPGTTPGHETGRRFVNFVASSAGQKIIREFGRQEHGEGLYQCAEKTQVHRQE